MLVSFLRESEMAILSFSKSIRTLKLIRISEQTKRVDVFYKFLDKMEFLQLVNSLYYS